jgi:hypothetical protein
MDIDEPKTKLKPPPNPPVPQPASTSLRRAVNQTHKYTFQIYVRTFPNEEETEQYTRLNIIQTVLTALQKGEPETKLILPADATTQQRTYSTININSKNIAEYKNIEDLLQMPTNGNIQGNLLFTSNAKYSTIKKNNETKKILLDKFKIITYLNNINAINITEVGFFTHHLVRHETAECTNWIMQVLSSKTKEVPPFQTEIVTVWAGPNKERKVAGVLKVFADSVNVSSLSKLLRETFNDKNENTFVPKEYFDTLDQLQKKEYIGSQFEYQTLYRTVLITGIKSITIPTTVTQQNEHLTVHDWLQTIPDLQQRNLFLHIQEVNTNEIEMKCLTTNMTIAKKWARNARIHIARVLLPIQLSSAFIQYEDLYQDTYEVEIWNPPPPPVIEFIQTKTQAKHSQKQDPNKTKKSNAQTKSVNQNKKTLTYKSVTETDNHTITTVNTQDSYLQDTISELQNTSQQHQQVLEELQIQHQQQHQLLEQHTTSVNDIEATLQNHQQILDHHSSRVDEAESTFQTHVSNFNSRLATLEEEQQVQQRLHDKLQEKTTKHSNDLQSLSQNLDEQQNQLLKYLRKQNKINDHNSNEINQLKQTQTNQQTMISTLQTLVLSLQNTAPRTPQSQQRIRKKRRPKTPDQQPKDSDSDEMESESELHQLHAITNLQHSSMEQISFIAQNIMEESIIEEFPPWDDDSSESEVDLTATSLLETSNLENQDNEESKRDLGNNDPGQGT